MKINKGSLSKGSDGDICIFDLEAPWKVDANKLKCNGWGQQAEILTHVINKKTKLFEIGINYHGRTYDERKKIW